MKIKTFDETPRHISTDSYGHPQDNKKIEEAVRLICEYNERPFGYLEQYKNVSIVSFPFKVLDRGTCDVSVCANLEDSTLIWHIGRLDTAHGYTKDTCIAFEAVFKNLDEMINETLTVINEIELKDIARQEMNSMQEAWDYIELNNV